ncbi:glycosyltransferase family 4 protein [Solibacillus sp. CAU 1738]|uniref:glycosyltransferase family 4 protein n=1 Tax=Solibacillus sp. CAU 1738 TaxID=3140363 RepID=UPI00325FE79D
MKVLFVASVYRHLVSFHLPYMQYFQNKGYTVYAVGNGDEDKQILSAMGIKCIDIPFSRNPFSSNNLHAYKQLKTLFKQHHFNLVHVHTPVAAFLTRFAFRKFKTGPIVYTAHGFHFYNGAPAINWVIYYPLEKIAARWTDHLITINDEDYNNARKFLSNERVSLVHGVGVEFSQQSNEISDLRKSLNIAENAVVISIIAELNKNKNQQYLLENWLAIKEQCPEVVLLIIGTGDLEFHLKNYVKDNHLQDVQFLGYCKDIDELLHISDISSLLSYREGLPKSTMESMYMGVPCIVTNTRGLRDLIIQGENGFIIPFEDDLELVNTFVRLISSKSLRIQMGAKSKQLVEPYILKNVLPEYITIYEKLLE